MKIEWVIVKGIADYADGTTISENWTTVASVMAASVVCNILSDATVFKSWPHYKGNDNFEHNDKKAFQGDIFQM